MRRCDTCLRRVILRIVTLIILITIVYGCPEPVLDPVVDTKSTSEKTYTSIKVTAEIKIVGTHGIKEHGFCWGTSNNPTINNTKSELGEVFKKGEYSDVLEDLDQHTTYYIKAYVITNEGEEFYGDQIKESTLAYLTPTLSTIEAKDITTTSATVGGNISNDGGDTITDRGVYYSTSTNAEVTGEKVAIGSGSGSFSQTISGLSEGKDYYVVAYATNSAGTSFGNEVIFTTGVTTTKAVVTTSAATPITTNSATVGGNVTNDGGATVTEKGVYYGTATNPESIGTKIQIGSGIGTFSTDLTGLSEGTTYYVRAYAINSNGESYGSLIDFTTSVTLVPPTVTTSSASGIENTSATVGGNVTNDGGATVTERGIYYGTSANPETTGTKVQIGSGTGTFSTTLNGLSIGTTYIVKAYASNSSETGYGQEIEFTTSGLTDYDGNTYETVTIGDQVWMAENLKVTHYPGGSAIPHVIDDLDWFNLEKNNSDDAYCFYNNNSSSAYGALYTYAAALNACPDGWHLPTDTEWKTLEMYLGMSQGDADKTGWRGSDEGGKLKETGTTHWKSPNTGATNETGFTALPGGYRSQLEGNFILLGDMADWWTATETSTNNAAGRGLYYNYSTISRYTGYSKSRGIAIRCLRD